MALLVFGPDRPLAIALDEDDTANMYPLASSKLIAFLATTDAARAKQFYAGTLGLILVSEDQFAMVFDVVGTMLRVTPTKDLRPVPYTILGWSVADIQDTAASLEEAGIKFEKYEGLGQDEMGIWSAPGGTKVAWFKDPDGNLLSISFHP